MILMRNGRSNMKCKRKKSFNLQYVFVLHVLQL